MTNNTGRLFSERIMKRSMIFLGLFLLAAQAMALPKPTGLKADGFTLSWSAVDGAGIYRVAVWTKPSDGSAKHLVSAVWVKANTWVYGDQSVLIAKAGKLPSTKVPSLDPGTTYRLWVAAAAEDGSDKSEWAAIDLIAPKSLMDSPRQALPALSPTAAAPASMDQISATATVTPTPALTSATDQPASPSFTPTPRAAWDAKSNTTGADLELDVADEFKEKPDNSPKASPTAVQTPSLEAAGALLNAGKAEDAQDVYKKMLEGDATNADAWEGLGDAYDADKMKIEAKECYEKALAIDPKRERLQKWLDDNVRH